MKVSYNWLKDYIRCGLEPHELAERLSLAGLEVETVTPIKPNLNGIVVGKVLSVEEHPGANRLSACQVTDGRKKLRIVCGAKNVRAGQMVPLARVGTRLPNGKRLSAANIRGVMSEGMICSERELELGEDASGIMVLTVKCKPGTDFSEALQLNDCILDINITPNRPDCLSVIGVAREIAAILGKSVKLPRFSLKEIGETTRSELTVDIKDAKLCPRYSGRLIKDVKVGPAAFWLRNRLGMVGVRAVNNVVDITNYVLMECGQPLHAFDFKKVRDGKIIVRPARAGERIITIDGNEQELEGGMLVIADSRRAIALAGIMGGLDTEVSGETTEVLLESAYFQPQSIRRTSRKLGLESASSYRFERGVDYRGVVQASDRAAYLISLLAGGKVCKGVVDRRPIAQPSKKVVLRVPRLNSILNTCISRPRAKRFLERLNMQVRNKGREGLELIPPSYRVDLKEEIDLIEEIARLEGFDRIEAVAPKGIVSSESDYARLQAREMVGDSLCSLGFSEAICLSFMGASEMEGLMWREDSRLRNIVELRNPVSEEFSYLRTSMLPPLMRSLVLNASRGNQDVRLFEFGTVFQKSKDGKLPEERERLAVVAMGKLGRSNWCNSPPEADFYYLKGVLSALLTGSPDLISVEREEFDSFHHGRSAALLLNGKRWGRMGEIHPRITDSYGIRSTIIFAEVDTEMLFRALAKPSSYKQLPRFPSVRRDIAVVAEEGLPAGSIINCIYGAAPAIVDSVDVFDLYRGEQITDGKKGLALSIIMRSSKETLKEKNINQALEKIRDALRKLGCVVRES